MSIYPVIIATVWWPMVTDDVLQSMCIHRLIQRKSESSSIGIPFLYVIHLLHIAYYFKCIYWGFGCFSRNTTARECQKRRLTSKKDKLTIGFKTGLESGTIWLAAGRECEWDVTGSSKSRLDGKFRSPRQYFIQGIQTATSKLVM